MGEGRDTTNGRFPIGKEYGTALCSAARTWDTDGRLTRIGYYTSAGIEAAGYDITWDKAGNITTKSGNSYQYDALERLTFADEKGTGTAIRLIAEASTAEDDQNGQQELTVAAADVEIKVDKASTSVGTTFSGELSFTKLKLKAAGPDHRIKARNVEAWVLPAESETWVKVAATTASVDADGNVTITFPKPEDGVAVKAHCLYDERDERDQAVDAATFIQRSDSILEVTYRTSRRRETYAYDAKGNRLEVVTEGIGEGTSETVTKSASYWPNTDRIKTYGEYTYVWDANGNLVEKGTEYTEGAGFAADSGIYARYEYDLWNRMTAVYKGEAGTASAALAATYAYGPDDIRVSKVSAASGGTIWLHDPAGRVLREEGETYARDYVWADGALIGYEEDRDADGDGERERFKRYILADHLGSAIAVLDETGNLLGTTDYSAFGESGGGSEDLAPIYTGKQWDADAGLYYFNARWYDPELGRFTTEDPIKDGGNWYAYVGNRPLVLTDPSGLEFGAIQDSQTMQTNDPKGNVRMDISFIKNPIVMKKASCLAVAVAKIINSINEDRPGYKPISAKQLVTGRSGFFKKHPRFVDENANMNMELVQDAIKYYTGKEYIASHHSNIDTTLDAVEKSDSKIYVIGAGDLVDGKGRHYVNVTGNAKKNGTLTAVGTSDYDKTRNYSLNGDDDKKTKIDDVITITPKAAIRDLEKGIKEQESIKTMRKIIEGLFLLR